MSFVISIYTYCFLYLNFVSWNYPELGDRRFPLDNCHSDNNPLSICPPDNFHLGQLFRHNCTSGNLIQVTWVNLLMKNMCFYWSWMGVFEYCFLYWIFTLTPQHLKSLDQCYFLDISIVLSNVSQNYYIFLEK